MTTQVRAPSAMVLLLLGAAAFAGCSDSSVVSPPTAPSSLAAIPTPPPGQLVSGTVSDSALRRLSGATVELLDGPQTGASAITNAMGQFAIWGTVDDATRFRASKDGHVPVIATIQPNCERCNPRRWVHLFLNVVEPPAAIAGDYTLTFTADPACGNIPDDLRVRSYGVNVARGDFGWIGFPAGAETSFKVTPRGLTFPEGLNSLWLNVAGQHVAVVLGDHTDPGVTEQVGEHSYLAFGGLATATVQSPVVAMSTPFEGWIDYCVNPGMPSRYDCSPGATVTQARCTSTKHQMTLTRR